MRTLKILAPTLALFIFCWLYFYPGFLSQDSWAQLNEARSGVFGDWHPPVMAWLWSKLLAIWNNPAGLLLLHLTFFFSALALWASRAARGWPFLLVALFPPLFALLGTLWKDVGLGIGLTALFGALRFFSAKQGASKLWIFLLVPLVIYVSAVRHNALPALAPVAIWIADFAYSAPTAKQKFLWLTGCTLITLTLLGLSNSWLSRRLLNGTPSTHPVQQIWLHDLVALSIESRELLVPQAFRAHTATKLADIEKSYSTRGVVPLFCCDPKVAPLIFSQSGSDLTELRNQWWNSLKHDPGAYLMHRWRNFRGQLGLERGPVCNPYLQRDPPAAGWRGALDRGLEKIQNTPLFRGWIYLLLNIFLLINLTRMRAWRQAHGRFTIALLSSGLAYTLPYFFVSTACDLRMHWWLILSTVLGLIEWRQRSRHLPN